MGEKKAILVVSFGTSYAAAREKNIDRIEQEICGKYPGIPVFRGWTSRMILKKIKERDGIHFDNIEEAMERMVDQKIRQVIVQPTHIMQGIENDRMVMEVLKYQDQFEKIVFGQPLLASEMDCIDTALAVMTEFKEPAQDEALVFMGHGTEHHANEVYASMDDIFKEHGYGNVYVGTVEGDPDLLDVMERVRRGNYRKVHLAPLMLVAGEHAVNDMAGDGSESWRSCFERAGYEVECHLRGLGEYSGIRKIFLKHLAEAVRNAE